MPLKSVLAPRPDGGGTLGLFMMRPDGMGYDTYISIWATAEELSYLHHLTKPWAKEPKKEANGER